MAESFNSIEIRLKSALKQNNFDLINALFIEEKSSFKDILLFYKRNFFVFESSLFWQSRLPHFHLGEVLQSDLKVDFLRSYFEKGANSNFELNKHLSFLSKQEFIKHFKLWKAYKHEKFFNFLEEISNSDFELKKLYNELSVIISAESKLKLEEEQDLHFIKQFSIDEFALGFSLYYYQFKQSRSTLGNKSWQTKIEMTLVNEFDKVLLILKRANKLEPHYLSNKEIQEVFYRNEAPHHILGKSGIITPLEEKFRLIYKIIDRLIERNARQGEIQLYLCGYSEFESITNKVSILKTNNEYKVFQINNAKSSPEELYFSTLRLQFGLNQKPSRTEVVSELKALKFNGIPLDIYLNEKRIDLEKVLKLLKYFAVYKGPIERTFYSETEYVQNNKADQKFIDLFGPNENITLFEHEELIKSIALYFNWLEDETRLIMDFLITDLSKSNLPLTWISSPFLKINDHILFLGSFLKDRRWDNIILNKLKREPESKALKARNDLKRQSNNDKQYLPLQNYISSKIEINIGDLFKEANFKTVSGLNFQSSSGERGDFDVLAYRDNYLFICEVKASTRSDEFLHAAKCEVTRLEGCAAGQLDKAISNIKEDWDNIKNKLGIDSPISYNEITTIPLIVTDYFEGDLRVFNFKYKKISILELEVILKNRKRDLLELYLFSKRFTDGNNANLKDKVKLVEAWDLWCGNKEITIENLLENIENNCIWKELESVWKFEESKYMIMA